MYSLWFVCSAFLSFLFLSTVPELDTAYIVLPVLSACAIGGICCLLLVVVCVVVDIIHAWFRSGLSFHVRDWDCDDMFSCTEFVWDMDALLACAACAAPCCVLWAVCVPFRVLNYLVDEELAKPVVIDKGATEVPLDYTTYPVTPPRC